jgi:hypothetical protein
MMSFFETYGLPALGLVLLYVFGLPMVLMVLMVIGGVAEWLLDNLWMPLLRSRD